MMSHLAFKTHLEWINTSGIFLNPLSNIQLKCDFEKLYSQPISTIETPASKDASPIPYGLTGEILE